MDYLNMMLSKVKTIVTGALSREVDYLNMLPVETWREIFLQLDGEPNNLYHDSLYQLHADESWHRNSRQTQLIRLQTITICKALYPIAIEMLHTEVVLSNIRQITQFVDSASREGQGKRYGERTRRMSLRIQFSSPDDENLYWKLPQVCPNLSLLRLELIEVHLFHWGKWVQSWSNSLVGLHWDLSFLPCQHTLETVSKLTSLKRLSITNGSLLAYGARGPPITLNNVEYLVLNIDIDESSLEFLDFPSLKWLAIPLLRRLSNHQIATFMQRHSATLRGIDITHSSYFDWHALCIDRMLDFPNLSAMVVQFHGTEGNIMHINQQFVLNHGLLTLFIVTKPGVSLWDLRSRIRRIKKIRFPSLDKVVSISGYHGDLEQLPIVLNPVLNPIPNIDSETRVDEYYK